VRAQVLVLRAPARVPARARTIRLRLATTVPARVERSRGRVRVDRRPRTVTLPIGRSARSVVVRLRTPAGVTRVTVRFARG
jgi:hypothetical protein